MKKKEAPVDVFLSSQLFKNLNVPINQLDVGNYQVKDARENVISIIIPFKEKNELKYIIGQVRNSNHSAQESLGAIIFEYNTSMTYGVLSEAIANRNYSGNIEITTSNFDYFNISVTEGKFALKQSKINYNGRVEACRGTVGSDSWVQGVASCAANSIDNMGPFGYAACILSLPQSWAIAVADCVWSGCAY